MDWVFDETLKMTYDNPIFLEQKKIRNENVDSTGFVAQYKLKDFVEDVEEDDSATKTDEDSDNDDELDEFDLNDFNEDDDVSTMYERMQKSKKASSTSNSVSNKLSLKSHHAQHSTEQKGSDDTDKKIKFNIKIKKDF